MKAIEILLKQFESFVQRALIPSVSFVFVFTLVALLMYNVDDFESVVNKVKGSGITVNTDLWCLLLIFLIGISFFLSILTQLIYDNLLKKNFFLMFNDTEDSLLFKYRELSIKKLKSEHDDIFKEFNNSDFTDYNLYQILGKKLSCSNDKFDTKRYVDDTKSIGIFFISVVLSILFFSILLNINTTIFLALLIGWIGYEVIKAKYRSRAIRLYVNYLVGKCQ